jgi:hypothetical protein
MKYPPHHFERNFVQYVLSQAHVAFLPVLHVLNILLKFTLYRFPVSSSTFHIFPLLLVSSPSDIGRFSTHSLYGAYIVRSIRHPPRMLPVCRMISWALTQEPSWRRIWGNGVQKQTEFFGTQKLPVSIWCLLTKTTVSFLFIYSTQQVPSPVISAGGMWD